MELFMTLLGVWLVAPVPLLILTIVFGCNSKKLKEQIRRLEKENELLRNKASEVPPTVREQVLSADNEAAAAENTQPEQPNVTETVQPPITEAPKAETPPPCQPAPNAESRYNMPYYGSAKSNDVPPVSQSAKSTPATAERAHKVSSINVMLILGALFIIISGLIFATTAWKFLSSGVRAIVIFSFSAVFFAVSSLAERKFKLPKTGVLFYTLGSTFLPITLIAAGYFKVFGEWFSLFGGGRALLLALTFAALSAVCIKGSCDYKSKAFSWCGLISFSAAVCSLIYQFTEDSIAVSALAVSIYSFAALFLCDLLSKKQSERFDVLISQLNTFAAVNTLILSISGIITTCSKEANGIISLIACIIFAAGYLKSSFTEKNGFSGAIPFTVLITFGMFAAFSPDNFRDVTCTVTLISVIPAALSLMGLVPEKLRGALKIISNIGAVIALVFCAAAALAAEPSWLALGAYAILAAEILVLGLMHKNEANGKAMLNVFPAACGVIALFLSRLIFSYAETPNKLLYTILTFTAFTAVLQVLFIFVFRTKLRTAASDVIFALSSGIAMFFVLAKCEYSAWLVLVSCLVTVGTVLLPAFDTEKPWKNTLFSSAAMIWSGFMAFPLSQLMENAVPQLSLGVSRTIILTSFSIVLTAVSAAVTFLCKNKTTDTAVSVALRLILSSYFIYLAALGNAFISPVFFIITAICLFREIKLKNNAEFTISNLLGIILAGLAAYDANRHFGFDNKLLYTILTFTAFTAVLQVLFIFVFRTKLRTAASDVIFALSSGIAMFFVLAKCEYSAWLVLVSCLVTVGTVLLPAFDTEKPWKNTLFSSAAMIWSGFMAFPLSQLMENAVPQLSLGVSRTIILTSFSIVLTAVSAAVTFLCKNKTTDTAVSVALRLILSSYFIYLAALGNAFISPVFFIITAICLFREIKLKNNAEFTISNLLGIILAGLAAYDANRHFGFEHIILFMCGMAAVIYIICLFTHEIGGSFEKISNIVSRYGMLVLTSLALFYLSVDGSPFSVAYTLMTLLFFLLTATSFYNSRFTIPLIIPFILFYTAAVNSLEEFFISAGFFVTYEDHLVNPILTYRNYSPTAIAAAVMIIFSIALSYILHRDYVLGKENRKMPDCFAITRFVGVIIYFNEALGDKDEWFSIWLTAACLLSLCRSEQKPVFRKWIYTVVLTAPVIAWIFQPFFELPDVIELELKILPVLIYCAVIRMLWKEKLTVIDNITFGIYAFSYLLLFADALSSGLIADGLIIVITSFILLVFSFIVKKKKWFILSVAVLLTATLFMSRNFWASLAWWVYLLAAGLILIAIGAANELKKQSAAKENKSEFEKKVTRFMSEWTW